MSAKAKPKKDQTAITVAIIAAAATLVAAIIGLASPVVESLLSEESATATVLPTSMPGTVPEATLTPPTPPILLQDDFSINRGLLVWNSERSFGGVMDGVYRMGVKQPYIVTWRVYHGLDMSDFDLKVKILMPQSTKLFSCGVVFRKSDQGRYLFGINNDRGYEFIKVTPSGEEITMIDWVTHFAVQTHGVNQLEVSAKGNVIELYINGEKLDSLLDDTHSIGEVGFYTSTYGGGEEVIVEFDDLLVEGR